MRIFTMLITIFWCLTTQAQEIRGIDDSPLDLAVFRPEGSKQAPAARILYSRPQKKGRAIFGELVPYGKIWRTGANQTTEVTLYRDFSFDGNMLKKGTYTLYTIPGKEEWTIIFNSKLHTWGHFDYEPGKDVLRLRVPMRITEKSREYFGMAFSGENGKGRLLMAWDKTEVLMNFSY